MAGINKLQIDLNTLLMQDTKANSEKHLVLSMLLESYTKRIHDIGYSFDSLLGFYQDAVHVINEHFEQYNLSNLLKDDSVEVQKLLQKVDKNSANFTQRWAFLDFENTISLHFEKTPIIEDNPVSEHHPMFSRPFFIAFKNLQS